MDDQLRPGAGCGSAAGAAPLRPPTVTIVVMGVSGVGKSTVAAELVERTGWVFAEGDTFHPESNRAKMASGRSLDDEDRWSWLRRITAWIGEQEDAGRNALVTCSALRRRYRDLLREGHPSVRFAQLVADPVLIGERLRARRGHYMPASLLDSQLATLEPLEPDEPGVRVPTEQDPATTAAALLHGLGQPAQGGGVQDGGAP